APAAGERNSTVGASSAPVSTDTGTCTGGTPLAETVITALPAASACTVPAVTPITAGALLAKTTPLVNAAVVPSLWWPVTVTACVAPMAGRTTLAGDTEIDWSVRIATVATASAVKAPSRAVIVAVPLPFATTRPDTETVATAALLVVQAAPAAGVSLVPSS